MNSRDPKAFAPLSLRLILGIGFIYHGFPKVYSSEGHLQFRGMLEGIGVPAPGLSAWMIGGIESLGAIALIAGAYVTVASLLLGVSMFGALLTVHLPQGFNFMNVTGMTATGPTFGMPGYEVNLLYLAGLATLILGGAGAFSVDAKRSRNTTSPAESDDPIESGRSTSQAG